MKKPKNKDSIKGCRGCCVFDLECPLVEWRGKIGKHFNCLCSECIIKCMCRVACSQWLKEIDECKNLTIKHAKNEYK